MAADVWIAKNEPDLSPGDIGQAPLAQQRGEDKKRGVEHDQAAGNRNPAVDSEHQPRVDGVGSLSALHAAESTTPVTSTRIPRPAPPYPPNRGASYKIRLQGHEHDSRRTRLCRFHVAGRARRSSSWWRDLRRLKEIKLTGTFTGLDLVNPHSWIYFEVTGPDGKVTKYRCEMRAATVLRRSGWSPEMFKKGERLTFEGSPDRNDPTSCYLNTIVFADGKRVDRYGQLTKGAPPATATRAARRATGEPNITGDWAPEQLVMTDPRGRGGALVPLSTASQFKPGRRANRRAARRRSRRSSRHSGCRAHT